MVEKRYRCSCGCLYFSLESVDYCERKLHPVTRKRKRPKVNAEHKTAMDEGQR